MRIPLSILASTATLALLALVVSPVGANESHFGVDDWKAADIAKHIKADVNIDVDTSAIEAVGLSGTTLFAVADTDLSGLGLKPAELAAVRKSLVQVMHRANVKPADFWEWRAVNRRLFDTWVLPLGLNDRALLIWMRFFDSNEAIEHINDEVDETNFFVFALEWIFVPSFPIFQVVRKSSDASSYIDELATFLYGVSLIGEIISTIMILASGQFIVTAVKTLNQQLLASGFVFVWATMCYYVFWWFIPNFLLTLIFYFNIYFLVPVSVIGTLLLPFLISAAFAERMKIM